MHRLRRIISIVALSLCAFLSCSRDENLQPTSTSTIIKQGKWKVTLFKESGRDDTHHFAGYEFTFSGTGKVSAVKNSTVVDGGWSEGTDGSKRKLILNFGSTEPFYEISEDWQILEINNSKIRLEDISGGSGETDLLTFQKI